MPELELRVSTLENMMKDLIYVHTQFEREMKEFKDEMKEFKNEMKEFKNEMKEFKNEIQSEFKQHKREMAGISKRLGTIVEDMVVPNIRRIAKRYFSLPSKPVDFMERREKTMPGNREYTREFDVICVYEDTVILNETKANPRMEYAQSFVHFIQSGEFFQFFPEYAGKKLIPIFASIYIPKEVVSFCSKNGIYVMGFNDITMKILNPDLQ